jgi:hypothetical protein
LPSREATLRWFRESKEPSFIKWWDEELIPEVVLYDYYLLLESENE